MTGSIDSFSNHSCSLDLVICGCAHIEFINIFPSSLFRTNMSEDKKKKTIEEKIENAGEAIGKAAKAFEKGVSKGMEKTGKTIEKDVKSGTEKTQKAVKGVAKKAKKKVEKK